MIHIGGSPGTGSGVSATEAGTISQAKVDTQSNGLNNFIALRSRPPRYDGERIYIRCHTASALSVFMQEGGGWFTGKLTAQADDGGYVASSGGAWHWVREKRIEDLYIGDFGGVADGITDAKGAFTALYTFLFSAYARARTGGTSAGSGGYSPYISIKYGPGNYYQTPGQYNKSGVKFAAGDANLAFNPSGYAAAGGVAIVGASVGFGKQVKTWFTSDKTNAPVFLLNHRRCLFEGLGWNGQQTTAMDQYNADTNATGTNRLVGATMGVWNDTASNVQQFIYNECPGGLYLRIKDCSWSNIGGDMFFVKDTLDTKIDGLFGSYNAAPVVTSSWSGQTVGVWDHSTSCEVRNCNFGNCASPALRMPRMTQAIMYNVWAEHGSTPFDLNNGQWDMNMICVEDCRANMCLWSSKYTIRTLSTPTGNDVSEASPTSGNYTGYLVNPDGSALATWTEQTGLGSWLLMNYGAYFNCPVITQVQRGVLRGTNDVDTNLWVNVGSFANPLNGGTWRIRVIGGSYFPTTQAQSMLADRLGGQSVISIGRGTGSTPKISYYNEGAGPLAVAPQYQTQAFNTTIPAVWVCIRARVGEWSITVEMTGTTRREAGTPSKYTPSGAQQTANPGLNAVPARFNFNTHQAGFGANADVVEILSRLKASVNGAVATPATDAQLGNEPVHPNAVRYMRINVGGQELALELKAWKPIFTTSNPATLSVATGGTLTLTTVVTDAISQQWQKSTDSGTTWTSINGATAVVLTIAGVTAADAGQYRLAVRANNGSGGDGITTYGNVTIVTIT